jgi:hypothetical protein
MGCFGIKQKEKWANNKFIQGLIFLAKVYQNEFQFVVGD